MSKDTVMKFFEAVQKDEAIAERLRAISKNVDAFARLSAELGREREFTFEPSDVREALDALARKSAAELSDKDLSAVSGGVGVPTAGICVVAGGGGAASGGCTGMLLGPPGAFFGHR
jgi:bacteriocin-like protein